jgi:long-chain acyl-CoA synthetase
MIIDNYRRQRHAKFSDHSGKQHPDKIATSFKGNQLTYRMLNSAANQVASGLIQAGIQKGDKVALSCPNLPYFPIVYYGILKAGATVVPLNVLLKSREIAYHLKDSEAKAYFCFGGTSELPMGRFGHEAFGRWRGARSSV